MAKQFKFNVEERDFKVSSTAQGWCGNRPKCVAIARKDEGVAIRDTKNPRSHTLYFNPNEWKDFLRAAKAGEFDV